MMQRRARQHWEEMAIAEDPNAKPSPPDYPVEFGFLNDDWDDVLNMGRVWVRKKVLPRGGGWLDQTEKDRHDLIVYENGLAYYRWLQQQKSRGNDAG